MSSLRTGNVRQGAVRKLQRYHINTDTSINVKGISENHVMVFENIHRTLLHQQIQWNLNNYFYIQILPYKIYVNI